jgi:hypothetical protein
MVPVLIIVAAVIVFAVRRTLWAQVQQSLARVVAEVFWLGVLAALYFAWVWSPAFREFVGRTLAYLLRLLDKF